MRHVHGFVGRTVPEVSPAEARSFKAVTIIDEEAFLAELNELICCKFADTEDTGSDGASLQRELLEKTRDLKAQARWRPSATAIQQGRTAMLAEYSKPQNLPLNDFAQLARKSRQQIYKDIAAKRLLALNVGKRGQRLPDWQLDPTALKLTQALLSRAAEVDEWTLYHALSDPLDALGGKSPIAAAGRRTLDDVVHRVLQRLDIRHSGATGGGG